ncbi:MAG: hypothetical protein MJ102_09340 [Clostridia bacterium]|nr:hypothetical protein [Clostridia bacterium]
MMRKRMTHRILTLILAVATLLTFTACDPGNLVPGTDTGEELPTQEETGDVGTEKPSAQQTDAPGNTPDGGYDFEGIGLTDAVCKALREIETDYGPGVYYSSIFDYNPSEVDTLYICKNGDKVVLTENAATAVVFTTNESYIQYTLNFADVIIWGKEYHGNYSVVDFADKKSEFYLQEYANVGRFFSIKGLAHTVPGQSAPEDYHEVIDKFGKFLLGPYDPVPPEGSTTGLWPLSYKRYANDQMLEHLNTQYMPKRNISYLDPVKDKIYSWEITYSVPELNTDYIFRVEFTDEITEADMTGLADRIRTMLDAELPGMMGCYEGSGIVYTFIEGENKDVLEDYYKILYLGNLGGGLFRSNMEVTYLNSLWIDGGSFCTYNFKKDGLHRKKNIEPYSDVIVVNAK